MSRSPITVWAVLHHYPPNFSGTAIQAREIYTRMVGKDFEVHFLTAADHEAANLAGQVVKDRNLTIHYLPVIRTQSWQRLSKYPFLKKVFRYANSVLHALSYSRRVSLHLQRFSNAGDILHLHSLNTFSFLLTGTARKRGLHPILLLTLLGSDDPGSFGGPFRGWSLRSFQDAEAIISISSALTLSCHNAGIDPLKVYQIPCGVDTQRFKPLQSPQKSALQQQLGLDSSRRYLVFAGSALHRKGIDVLVAAFIELAGEYPYLDLLVVGPHDFSDHTRHEPGRLALVDKLKLDLDKAGLISRVHWLGQVDNVHDYMASADIFVFPTRREGFGIVIAEALSSGLPCVVARIEGVTTDLIPSEGTGILVEGYNPLMYAGEIRRILSDFDLNARLIHEARMYALENYSLEKITVQFSNLYRELAGNCNV